MSGSVITVVFVPLLSFGVFFLLLVDDLILGHRISAIAPEWMKDVVQVVYYPRIKLFRALHVI